MNNTWAGPDYEQEKINEQLKANSCQNVLVPAPVTSTSTDEGTGHARGNIR